MDLLIHNKLPLNDPVRIEENPMTSNSTSSTSPTKGHNRLLYATAVITFLLVTLGGVVCVTDSSQGCPDWPWCYGKLYPPLRQDSIIEYSHRVVALVTSLLILASAVLSLLKTPRKRWVSIPAALSLVTLVAVSYFGAKTVMSGLTRVEAALDLGSALVTVLLMITAAAAARRYREQAGGQIRLVLDNPFSWLVFGTTLAAFVLLVSAVLVAASGSVERCLGFPLFSEELLSSGMLGSLQIARRGLAVVTALLIAAVAERGWRTQRGNGRIMQSATLLIGALVVELITGVLLLSTGFSLILEIVYVSMASSIWALLCSLLMQTALKVKPSE